MHIQYRHSSDLGRAHPQFVTIGACCQVIYACGQPLSQPPVGHHRLRRQQTAEVVQVRQAQDFGEPVVQASCGPDSPPSRAGSRTRPLPCRRTDWTVSLAASPKIARTSKTGNSSKSTFFMATQPPLVLVRWARIVSIPRLEFSQTASAFSVDSSSTVTGHQTLESTPRVSTHGDNPVGVQAQAFGDEESPCFRPQLVPKGLSFDQGEELTKGAKNESGSALKYRRCLVS